MRQVIMLPPHAASSAVRPCQRPGVLLGVVYVLEVKRIWLMEDVSHVLGPLRGLVQTHTD